MRMTIVKGRQFWVDEESRIFGYCRKGGGKYLSFHEFKPRKSKRGYMTLILRHNGKYRSFYAHTIIASAWHTNPEGKRTVNHKNGVPTDNRIDNLEWATYQEQERHKIDVLGKGNAPGLRMKNDTGGVCWCKKKQMWRAYDFYNYRQKHLGYFYDKAEAHKVATGARIKRRELMAEGVLP